MLDAIAFIAQLAGAITAIAAAAAVLSRLKPIKWLWRQIVTIPISEWFRDQVIDEILPRLDPIERELNSNGGGSVKDLVKQTSVDLDLFKRDTDKRLQKVEATQVLILRRLPPSPGVGNVGSNAPSPQR